MSAFNGAFLSALMRHMWERKDQLLTSLLEVKLVPCAENVMGTASEWETGLSSPLTVYIKSSMLFPSAKKVMTTKWETDFSSLPLTECIEIFAEVSKKHDLGHELYKDVRDAIATLATSRCYITVK